MRPIIFLFLFFALCFSASASHLVYVENATSYYFEGTWFPNTAPLNDTNYATYAFPGDMCPDDKEAYMNYTLLTGFINGVWTVKDEKGTANLSTSTCNVSSIAQFKAYSLHGTTPGICFGSEGKVVWYCLNSSGGYDSLRDTGINTDYMLIYEEGLWQNISDGTSISSITPVNSSSLSVSVNCTLTPIDGSVSSVNVTLNGEFYVNVDSCNASFTLPGEGLFNGSITAIDSYGVSNTTTFTVNVSGLPAPPVCVDDFSMPALNLGITIAILFGLTAMLIGKKEHLGSWLTITIFILVMAFVIWAMNNWNQMC